MLAKAEPEEVAEAYAMGSLSATDSGAFNEHLLVCRKCQAAVENAEEYVRAMRTAAAQIRKREGTADRPR